MDENSSYDDVHSDGLRTMEEEAAEYGRILNFTDLRVWQGAMDLAEKVYRLTWLFPSHEQYGLSSQLQRSAVSVPSNVAEGHARNQTGDFLRFLAIARGSAAEMKTQLLLAQRLDYVDTATATKILADTAHVLRQLTALRTSIERHNRR